MHAVADLGVRVGDVVGAETLVGGLIPRLAAVVGALEDLTEPSARLRGVDPVWIRRRSLEVIDLPPGEMRSLDLPALAAAIGGQDERTLSGADQYANSTHCFTPRDKQIRSCRYRPTGTVKLIGRGEHQPRGPRTPVSPRAALGWGAPSLDPSSVATAGSTPDTVGSCRVKVRPLPP